MAHHKARDTELRLNHPNRSPAGMSWKRYRGSDFADTASSHDERPTRSAPKKEWHDPPFRVSLE